MGIKLFSDDGPTPVGLDERASTSPNPNPFRFSVVERFDLGRWSVLRVNYPDCTTHGGDKVMVYDAGDDNDDGGLDAALARRELDPHFLERGPGSVSPAARFPGTDDGFAAAIAYVRWLAR